MRDSWILDRLLRAGGIDVLWPEVTGTLLEMGFKYADVDRAMSRVGSLAAMPKQWLRLADHHFDAAENAQQEGHNVTASETYYRATGCYARARWGALEPGERQRVYERLVESYQRGIAVGEWPVERVEIPFGDRTLPAILHLPADVGSGPPPAVVVYPGMDMTKEYFPVPFNNVFSRRGIAALVIDPPGQGENEVRGLLLAEGSGEAAGSAALDFLQARAGIDGERLAAFGIGTSSYTAFSLAASENRLTCAVGFEGADFYDRVRFIDDAQPAFEARMKRMSGLDGEEFRSFIRSMTLDGREKLITVPLLLMVGEWDEHVSLSETRRFFSELEGPRRLAVYEGENHVLGRVSAEALPAAVDWIGDRFAGIPMGDGGDEVLVLEY